MLNLYQLLFIYIINIFYDEVEIQALICHVDNYNQLWMNNTDVYSPVYIDVYRFL